jgi:hypothetical protein
MERHCHRQFLIAERLAGARPYDRELVLCACWLHDAGAYVDSSAPYVTEGGLLAARVVEPFAREPERRQQLHDACEQHHAPRSRIKLGLEVELLRQSDLVDVSAGLVRFGGRPQLAEGPLPGGASVRVRPGARTDRRSRVTHPSDEPHQGVPRAQAHALAGVTVRIARTVRYADEWF